MEKKQEQYYFVDLRGWSDEGGNSLWQWTFPSLAVSTTDDDVMYVVSSRVTEGEELNPDGDPWGSMKC